MKIHEFGGRKLPHVLLIHGGGQAWWDYLRQARMPVSYPYLDVYKRQPDEVKLSEEEELVKLCYTEMCIRDRDYIGCMCTPLNFGR